MMALLPKQNEGIGRAWDFVIRPRDLHAIEGCRVYGTRKLGVLYEVHFTSVSNHQNPDGLDGVVFHGLAAFAKKGAISCEYTFMDRL